MITDNLAPLFAGNPRGAAMSALFRVGVLAAFNADDGSNTVMIGTSEIPDLPLLATGAEIGLEAGDNVLIMYLGNTAMIVGKVATVGGPNYGASNQGRATASNDVTPVGGFGIPLAGQIGLVPVHFPVPGWAHSALMIANAGASLHSVSTTASNAFAALTVKNGSGGLIALGTQFSNGYSAGFQSAINSYLNEVVPVTPGDTVALALDLHAGVAWPTDAGAGAVMQAAVEFYREGI